MQPIFDSLAPPGMSLTFAKLQFGDAPLRVEAVRMDRQRYDGVYLEMDVRWAGEPECKLKVGVKGCANLLLRSADCSRSERHIRLLPDVQYAQAQWVSNCWRLDVLCRPFCSPARPS